MNLKKLWRSILGKYIAGDIVKITRDLPKYPEQRELAGARKGETGVILAKRKKPNLYKVYMTRSGKVIWVVGKEIEIVKS